MNWIKRPEDYPKWYVNMRVWWDENKEAIIRALVYVSLVASLIKALTSLICLFFFNDTETLKGFVSQISCIALVLYIVYWFKPQVFEMYVNKFLLQLFLNKTLRGFILLFFDAHYSMFYLNYTGLKGTGTENKSKGDWLYANLEASTVLYFLPYFCVMNNLYTLACINSFFILLGRLCLRVLDFGVNPAQLNMEYIRKLIEDENFIREEIFNSEKFKSLPPKVRYIYKSVYVFTKYESSTYLPLFIFLVSFYFRYTKNNIINMFININTYASQVSKFRFKPLRLAVSRQASTSAIQMFNDIPKVHLYYSGIIVSKAADKGQKIAKNAIEEVKAHPVRTVVAPTAAVCFGAYSGYKFANQVIESNNQVIESNKDMGQQVQGSCLTASEKIAQSNTDLVERSREITAKLQEVASQNRIISRQLEEVSTQNKHLIDEIMDYRSKEVVIESHTEQKQKAKDLVDNKELSKLESNYLSQEQIKTISDEINGDSNIRQNSLNETVGIFSSNSQSKRNSLVEDDSKDEIKLNSVFEDLGCDSSIFGFIGLVFRFFKRFRD